MGKGRREIVSREKAQAEGGRGWGERRGEGSSEEGERKGEGRRVEERIRG